MRRLLLSTIGGLVVVGCALEIAWNPKPVLVWNVTASAPIGLYRRSFSSPKRADWVLITPPRQAHILAARRGYLPLNVPMVKRIAALSGDTVCRTNNTVTVNGTVRAIALSRDSRGRVLPVWQGCERLNDNQTFVLTAPSASFDSRYFGVVPRANIIERIEPLWTF
jgi:conjugative transfer signal peptidase TraF